MIEFMIRVFMAPLFLTLTTLPVLAFFNVAITTPLFFVVWVVWIILVNGGILILDGDLLD